jgi:hypothetical protein
MICVGLAGTSCSWVDVSGKTYTLNTKPSSNYFWTVYAKGLNGELTNSGTFQFSTKSCPVPPAPSAISPIGQFVCGSASSYTFQVTLQWSPVSGATEYELTVEWAPNAASGDWNTKQSILSAQYLSGTSYGPITLTKGKYYTWELRTRNSCGWGPIVSYFFICGP